MQRWALLSLVASLALVPCSGSDGRLRDGLLPGEANPGHLLPREGGLPADPFFDEELQQQKLRAFTNFIRPRGPYSGLDPDSLLALLPALSQLPNQVCTVHVISYLLAIANNLGLLTFPGLPDLELPISSFNGTWPLLMLDAMGKIPDGIMEGNVYEWGSYDECMDVRAEITEEIIQTLQLMNLMLGGLIPEPDLMERKFQGHYCLISFYPPSMLGRHTTEKLLPSIPEARMGMLDTSEDFLTVFLMAPPSFGLCMPSTCSPGDIQGVVSTLVAVLAVNSTEIEFLLSQIYPVVRPEMCYIQKDPSDPSTHFTTADIVVLSIIVVFAVLIACGTLLDLRIQARPDLWTDQKKDKGVMALVSFSAYTNGKKILNTESTSETLGCLHGLRFYSMTWVVLGHTYFTAFAPLFKNLQSATRDMFDNWAFMAIANATVSVDTFFFLSGLLVAYILLRDLKRSNGKFNPVLYYLHRFIRLTPALAMTVALMATLARFVGSGPLWGGMESTAEICRKSWWRTVFYLFNIEIDGEYGSCVGQTWYLACDMHMYWASPFLVVPLFYMPMYVALGYLSMVLLGMGFVWPSILYRNNDFPATIIPNQLIDSPDFSTKAYFATHVRSGPYIVGIILGYILFKFKDRKIQLRKEVVWLGWALSTGVALAILYGLKEPFRFGGKKLTPEMAAFYGGVHRTVWAMCIAWVVFACVHGYGGFVNTLLSWKALMPFSRLTYCSYLLSLNIQLIYQGSRKAVMYMDHPQMVYWFLGILTITEMGAFVFSLMFESPFLGLEKVIFPLLDEWVLAPIISFAGFFVKAIKSRRSRS